MRWLVASASAFFAACGEDPEYMQPPKTQTIKVSFEYRAPTEIDPTVREMYRACTELVGPTHIHPSWQDYRLVRLSPRPPDRYTRVFVDVPAESVKIRVSDPNACDTDINGAVTEELIYANGVLLTHSVTTPGDGPEPGFAFVANADGTVTP